MFRSISSIGFSRYMRFSLRGGFLALTLSCVAFGTWWQWPVQIDRVPKELGEVRPKGGFYCRSGPNSYALWDEVAPPDLTKSADPFGAMGGRTVYVAYGKCSARRDWQTGWVLHGPAEVFTADHLRVVEASYDKGKLEGEFRAWYTCGRLRESGKYWHGQKDGIWEIFDQHSGTVLSREEYVRGMRVGIWTKDKQRDHYQAGRLRLRERQQGYPGNCLVEEFDTDEKLKRVVHWNKARDQILGEDQYEAGVRHGDWYRVKFEDQRPLNHRGQWADGLPSGKWVYEQEDGPPLLLDFRQGALAFINGEPSHDLLMQKYRQFARSPDLQKQLIKPEGADWYMTRGEAFEMLRDHQWPAVMVDSKLGYSQAEFERIWNARPGTDFDYSRLPVAASVCLILHDANLAVDYRHGLFWVTTPALAAKWRDRTETREWFRSIVEAVPTRTVDADGDTHYEGSPYHLRLQHFGEDWKQRWDQDRKLEFARPIRSALGVARRIDGSKVPATVRLQLPQSNASDSSLEFDEFITLECELSHCRLRLEGDTLLLQ